MKKITLLTALLSFALGAFAQKGLYNLDKIQDIKIVFGYTDWNAKMVAQKAGAQEYILAASCTINGEKFDSVGVKYKGNSSYKANNKKNPLHVKLDWKKNQSYNGVTSVKLGNIYADASYVREPLSYKLLSNYMDCPRANYAKVFIEDKYYGLMSNVEPINDKFVSDHFGSSDNTFIKCNPKFGAGLPGGNNIPNLVFLSYDTTQYAGKYELESKTGWKDLLTLIDTLAKKPSGIHKVLDVDKALWMLAFNNVFVNLDSYTGSFAQNYYLYKDDNGRFIPIVWDLNMSFASFTLTGGTTGGTSTNLANMAYDLHKTNAARPLIKVLLSNPTYERMYIAHIRTMLKECFVNKLYQTEAKMMRDSIDAEVKKDANPFSTYTAFQNAMTAPNTGAGQPGQNVMGISTLMEARTTYLLGLAKFTAEAPSIENVDYAPKSAKVGEDIWVTAKIHEPTAAFVSYREDSEGIFEKIQMFDDGKHQDGAAGDGIFGASLKAKDFKMQYYIYAENNDAGVFSPERAEHEFHSLKLANAGTSSVSVGDLLINEIMPANTKTATDPSDNAYDDWMEFYNKSNTTLSFDNLYLTDDFTKKDKWQFPKGLTIPAKGRLIVWVDSDAKSTIGVHTSFKLSSAGEQIMLSKADGTILDSLTFKSVKDDHSVERCPDGTGAFKSTSKPTYNAENCKPLATNDYAELIDFQVFPNPTTTLLNVTSEDLTSIEMMNLQGQKVLALAPQHEQNVAFSIEHLPAGLYFVRVNKTAVKRVLIVR
jgi:hypothetical protein